MVVQILLPLAMNSKDEGFFKALGARIAQQTLAHYEVGRLRVPASMLSTLAQLLTLSLDELINAAVPKRHGRRGPTSRLQQQTPKTKQRFVSQMLDTVLAQAGQR